MSTPTAVPGPGRTGGASGADVRRRLRLSRPWLVVGGVVLSTLVAVVLWGRQPAENTTPLDPANTRPEGSRAVARVLAAEGVQVEVARGRDELDDLEVDPRTTLVVTSADELGSSTVQHVLGLAPARTVIVTPPARVTQEIAGIDPVRTDLGDRVRGRCRDPRLDGLQLFAGAADTYPGPGCFGTERGRAVLVSPVDGVELLGAGSVLTNGQVTSADNAAIALRLLGSTDRLVWYVPSSTDLAAGENAGLSEVLPDWLAPGLRLLLVAAVALLLWRVSRFGPLAVEPLPVHVRAVEATVGRGRSYRRSGDRAHVAEVLRSGARRQLADLLLVDRNDADALAHAAAARTTRTHDEVRALIAPSAPAPTTDAALVHLAQELAALTEEVRQP